MYCLNKVEFQKVEDSGGVTNWTEVGSLDHKDFATRILQKGAVEFYDCSKRRQARVGCLLCCPTKTELHKKKFPDKYSPDGQLVLSEEQLAALSVGEFVYGNG